MKLRSTPKRRPSLHVLVAAIAIFAALILPAAASANHKALMGPVTLTAPGCQAKGMFAFPGPKSSGAGLPAGVYYYTVTAVVGGSFTGGVLTGGTETTPCAPVPVGIAGTAQSNSTVMQWNAVPGATVYKIYRSTVNTAPTTDNLHPLAFGAGPPPPIFLPPAAVCPPGGNGSGPRCTFQDNGGPSATGQTPPA